MESNSAPLSEFTLEQYDAAAEYIRSQSTHRPRIGLILGSGLNALAEQIEAPSVVPYAAIPYFPVSTVEGHTGQLVIGKLAGAVVCVMQGRFHYYEGYSLQQVTLPIRVMQRLGIQTLILTNAAGGMNPNFQVGDIMLIEDHINFPGMAGHNPLRGPNLAAFGVRFPATNHIYTHSLRDLAFQVAASQGLTLRRGIYTMVAGPNFESPAEIRLLRGFSDAVGMSTAPEALVAHHAGMEVMAFSTITNAAIDAVDVQGEPTHQEVIDAGQIIVPRLTTLLSGILAELAGQSPDR
jgi:purine-nucleoside phosphorylase